MNKTVGDKVFMNIETIILPEQVRICMDRLNQSGFSAFLVGGCVRDYLLSRETNDIDIATNANPAEVKRVFAEYKTIETGLKHGTVTVIIHSMPIEITTFRTQKEARGKLAGDLAKRDFTINALAYHTGTGIIDYCAGTADLRNKVIRCVGNPEERFGEDGLRILRALRFASVLNFEIEKQTETALFAQKELLKRVAKERIAVEMVRLLCGKNARRIIIEYIEVLGVFMPDLLAMKGFEQNNDYHIYDVLTHSAFTVAYLPPIPHLRLAGLLHDIGKPHTYHKDALGIGHFYGHQELSSQMAKRILEDLKFSSFTVERVYTLIKYHDMQIEPKKKQIKRWLNRLSPEVLVELLIHKKADMLAQNPKYSDRLQTLQEINDMVQTILSEQSCYTLKTLKLNGNDLIELGFKPGQEIGKVLNHLLTLVMDDEIANDHGTLVQYVQEHVQK
jgi:tRNA nucleotidyltransferase (CCA-adding enzyme)